MFPLDARVGNDVRPCREWVRASPASDDEPLCGRTDDHRVASPTSDAAGDGQEPCGPAAVADSSAPRFGLATATALTVRTIIGVGIFNLPT